MSEFFILLAIAFIFSAVIAAAIVHHTFNDNLTDEQRRKLEQQREREDYDEGGFWQ